MKLVHNEYTKRYFLKTPAHTIQMKPIYDAFHLNNKVTVHEIIQEQLSLGGCVDGGYGVVVVVIVFYCFY